MANYFKYLDHEFVIAPSEGDKRERVVENSCSMASDLITSTLNVSVLYLTVESDASAYVSLFDTNWVQYLDKDGTVLCYRLGAGDDLTKYKYATPLYWYKDGVMQFKFYVVGVERVAQNLVEFTCVSEVGLLESQHYGGMYLNTPLKDVLKDIIGDAFKYTIDPKVESLVVSNYLPIKTRRENLHQVMFTLGLIIKHDENGDAIFTAVDTQAATIPIETTYTKGSVKYATPVSKVTLTEHSYIKTANDNQVTLYESSSGTEQDDQPIKFMNPCYDLQTTGELVIIESGVNYAKVQGVGTLTGKEYTHIQRDVVVTNPDATVDNPLDVQNVTLVNILNSSAIAERLIKYNSNTSSIKMSFVHNGEGPNDYVDFISPFFEPEDGFLKKMDFTISKEKTKVSAEVICGYASAPVGDYYNRVVEITQDGPFIIPQTVTSSKIRIVAVGCGFTGENGSIGEEGDIGVAGAGGPGGKAGAGGHIYNVEIDTVKGKSYEVYLGKDGNGEDSRFGDISSSQGSSLQYGFVCPLTGKIYGARGLADGPEGLEGYGLTITREMYPFIKSISPYGDIYNNKPYTIKCAPGASGTPIEISAYTPIPEQSDQNSASVTLRTLGRTSSPPTPADAADGVEYGQGGSGGRGGQGGSAIANYPSAPSSIQVKFSAKETGTSEIIATVRVKNTYREDTGESPRGWFGKGGKGKQGCILVYYRED